MIGFKVKDKIGLPHFSEISTFLILCFIPKTWAVSSTGFKHTSCGRRGWLLSLQTEKVIMKVNASFSNVYKILVANSDLKGLYSMPKS